MAVVSLSLLWLSVLLAASSCPAAASPGSTLSAALTAALLPVSNRFNISLVAAITFNTTTTPTAGAGFVTGEAAVGMDDRAGGGVPMTTSTLVPAGSATKALTATAAMAMVELGHLDLDRPAHLYLDPWLAAQGRPPLLTIWDNEAAILGVTSRQLLAMRAGIRDYPDGWLLNWTLTNPGSDFDPFDFVALVDKAFLAPPGTGPGHYSSIGVVLAGMVLAAVSGAPSWDRLNQTALLQLQSNATGAHPPVRFDDILFMGRGPCTVYPRVSHQYVWQPHPTHRNHEGHLHHRHRDDRGIGLGLAVDAWAGAGAGPGFDCQTQQGWHPGVHAGGDMVGWVAVANARGCCAAAGNVSGATVWSFLAGSHGDPTTDPGNCTFFAQAFPAHTGWSNATTGTLRRPPPPPIAEDQFVDIDGLSCLNGWTMGNVACTAGALAKFYANLAHGRLVAPESLAAMHDWRNMSGPLPGSAGGAAAQYGLGQFELMVRFSINATDCPDGLPFCSCGPGSNPVKGQRQCWFNPPAWGHGGLDWGSGFPLNGHVPALGLSFALGSNVGEGFPLGMNATLSFEDNRQAYNDFDIILASFWTISPPISQRLTRHVPRAPWGVLHLAPMLGRLLIGVLAI